MTNIRQDGWEVILADCPAYVLMFHVRLAVVFANGNDRSACTRLAGFIQALLFPTPIVSIPAPFATSDE